MAERPSLLTRIGRAMLAPLGVRRWEAAKTSRLNSAHWSGVTDTSINQDLQGQHGLLRARSTHEAANNPFVEGAIETHAIDVVGEDGPALQVQCEIAEYATAAEELWRQFCCDCEANGQMEMTDVLDLLVRTLWKSGEYFAAIISDEKAPTAIKTRVQVIHPRRVPFSDLRPLGSDGTASQLGIKVSRTGRPLAYFVEDGVADMLYGATSGKATEIPAANMVHWFRSLEPGQLRGVPWLSSALQAVADLRDFDTSTLDAARAAADHAVVLSTSHPAAEYVEVDASVEIKRRQITTMPPGWTPTQIDPKHPTTSYQAFRSERLREIGRPVGMPLMLVQLDSGNHNYSSARFDGQVYQRMNRKLQRALQRKLLVRLFSAVMREAKLLAIAGKLPEFEVLGKDVAYSTTWTWPVPAHVDPSKEQQAESGRLKDGTTTKAAVCAANGTDWESVLAQRDREIREEHRLAIGQILAAQEAADEANAANPQLKLHWSHVLALGGATSAPGAFLQGAAPNGGSPPPATPPKPDPKPDDEDDSEDDDQAEEKPAEASRFASNGIHR